MPFARFLPAVGAALLVTSTGCSSAHPERAVTRVPVESPPPAATPAAPEAGSGNAALDRFVAAVQRRLPDVALDRRDEEIEDLGRQACASLAAGKTTAAAAARLADLGVGGSDARTLITLARGTACR